MEVALMTLISLFITYVPTLPYYVKGAVMQIEKALINDRWKYRIPTIYNFEVIYP